MVDLAGHDALTHDAMRDLLERGDGADRAYVDAMIRMGWARTSDPGERAALEALNGALLHAASLAHEPLRSRIRAGALRGPALRAHFDGVPSEARDLYVEEVLGIAYPPLEEQAPSEPELVAYQPSGYDEIVHAFDAAELASGDRFVDLGSGLGKAVLLAALLSGAASSGLERDAVLHRLAERAARDLGLGAEHARFEEGDARTAPIADADLYFMYLPFTGAVLAHVMDRLVDRLRKSEPRSRRRFVSGGALAEGRYPELIEAGPPRSWLHVYAWSPPDY